MLKFSILLDNFKTLHFHEKIKAIFLFDGPSESVSPFLDFPQMGESKNEIKYFAFFLIT